MTEALDLRRLRDRPHLSFSQLSTYIHCPRQHRYRYIDRIHSTHQAPAIAFGKALHLTLEWYYTNKQKPDATALRENFEFSWATQLNGKYPIQFAEKETAEGMLAQGLQLLTVFKEKAPVYPEIIAVEQPFSIEIIDFETGEVLPPLIGAFDLIVRNNAGRLCIIDHKTGKAKWSDQRLAEDLQLSSYHYAAQQLGYGPVELGVQLFLKKKQPDFMTLFTHRNTNHHRDFIDTAIGIQRAVDANVSFPIRGWMCAGCNYQQQCNGEGGNP